MRARYRLGFRRTKASVRPRSALLPSGDAEPKKQSQNISECVEGVKKPADGHQVLVDFRTDSKEQATEKDGQASAGGGAQPEPAEAHKGGQVQHLVERQPVRRGNGVAWERAAYQNGEGPGESEGAIHLIRH